MDMEGFPAERKQKFQAPINWRTHSRPQNCGQKKFTGTRIFLNGLQGKILDDNGQIVSSLPSLEFVREFLRFFPCLDKAIGKTTIPEITRNGQKHPQWRLIATNRRLRASSGGVGVFQVKGVGAKKFGMYLETQGNQTFGRDTPRIFAGISRRCPKSLRTKRLCSILVP